MFLREQGAGWLPFLINKPIPFGAVAGFAGTGDVVGEIRTAVNQWDNVIRMKFAVQGLAAPVAQPLLKLVLTANVGGSVSARRVALAGAAVADADAPSLRICNTPFFYIIGLPLLISLSPFTTNLVHFLLVLWFAAPACLIGVVAFFMILLPKNRFSARLFSMRCIVVSTSLQNLVVFQGVIITLGGFGATALFAKCLNAVGTLLVLDQFLEWSDAATASTNFSNLLHNSFSSKQIAPRLQILQSLSRACKGNANEARLVAESNCFAVSPRQFHCTIRR